jgi:hypothetical protein
VRQRIAATNNGAGKKFGSACRRRERLQRWRATHTSKYKTSARTVLSTEGILLLSDPLLVDGAKKRQEHTHTHTNTNTRREEERTRYKKE